MPKRVCYYLLRLRDCVFRLSLTTALLLPVVSAKADPPLVRIMPLGDSITQGVGGTSNLGGYRGTLYTLLTNAGYAPDFVGTQTVNSASLADPNHQGMSGWRIAQLDSNIEGWLAAIADPDVVLLHIGTNDFGNNDNINTAINRLDALILKIATLRPNANIIVTNLMERGEPHNTNIQTLFNPQVPAVVSAHAAAGRKVTFLDMRSAVPLSDMPDNLHPNQAGYDKMANAWLGAVQAVISPQGDSYAPLISRVRSQADLTSVVVRFSKPVADNAANMANFTVDQGLQILSSSLSQDKREVTLTTSLQTLGTTYTLTVNNVQDRLASPLSLAANTTAIFAPPLPRGYALNVPESSNYTLVQMIDMPVNSAYGGVAPPYAVDNRAYISGFDRIAYYLELEKPDGTFDFVWVSMDAFTNNVNQIALPTFASGAVFEQNVENLNVVSSVAGVTQGNGLAGNIEFWPTNYTEAANSGLGGNSTIFDFDDTRSTTGTFGSMQVHNRTDKATIFAINDWGGATAGSTLDIGIGSQTTGSPDWTFAESGGWYLSRKLHVFVRAAGDNSAPTLLAATASNSLARIYVDFSEPVRAESVTANHFSLSHGVTVLAVELANNGRQAVLTTTSMPTGQTLTLTVDGIRDVSPAANKIAPNTTIPVALPTVPTEISSKVGNAANNYQLVYSIDLPQVGNLNALGNKAYSWDDSGVAQPFSRVAYYLETQKPGATAQYVWVSMKAFTQDRKKIGIPTVASKAVYQMLVQDMEVQSNVAGITTGTGITTGNIEFWPTDYDIANGLSIPGADATKYDFGDTRKTNGSFGSMQVHNYGAQQTLFAINHWGADNSTLDIGIGNQTTTGTGVDWTNAANAGTYFKRRLHVLVLPSTPTLPTEVANQVPSEAQGYQLVYSLNIPAQGNMVTPAYTVDNSAQIGSFSRVAYYMQLQTGSNEPEWVWVSMDAFTSDATRIGIPTAASGAVHQRILGNMSVRSNKSGIVTGDNISTGNIEFWPFTYTASNALSIQNASDSAFDFGDTRGTSGAHGSMQIHNHGASQTLFSITNWATADNTTNKFGLGIGNQPSGNPDWTFANNSANYSSRLLYVLVLPGDPDFSPPSPTLATGAASLNKVALTFNEPVAESSVVPSRFTIPGLVVSAAQLQPGQRVVVLTTSAQTPGSTYTISVNGIKDISTRGNETPPSTSVTFTAFSTPELFSSIPQTAGYQLVYRVAIPAAAPAWNVNTIPYSVDEPKFRNLQFDRVAYVLELDSNWVFTSFDRHTSTFAKVGIPTLNVTSTPFQMNVSNLTVASNVPGIVSGDFATGGNIEFWGGNYNILNSLGIPNASDATYDWGDRMDSGGYGSLQVHNNAQQQVLLAYNNWGNSTASAADIGIGSRSTSHPDWTMSNTTTGYTKRNLYILVRPGGIPSGDAPIILASPTARTVNPGTSTTFSITTQNTTVGTQYQWRRNSQPIPGATLPWLELTSITGSQEGAYDVVVTGENLVSSTSTAAQLTVTNQAPSFLGFKFTTPINTPATFTKASLLARANDEDADVLSVTNAGPTSQQGGTATLSGSTITYAPPTNHLGNDSFDVVIADGRGGTIQGTVQVTVIGSELPKNANGGAISQRADGKVDLAFRGTAGTQYDVRRSSDLITWETVATLTAGDDGVVPFVEATPPTDRAFYRLEVHPTP